MPLTNILPFCYFAEDVDNDLVIWAQQQQQQQERDEALIPNLNKKT